MKLANSKKFKRAFKVVEDYLYYSAQGIEHLDEWREEVEVARKYLDPEDFGYFDGYVAQLEKKGLEMYGVWKTLHVAEDRYQEWLDEMFDTIWSRVKKVA